MTPDRGSRYRHLRPEAVALLTTTGSFEGLERQATRYAYAEAILELAAENPDIVVLDADVSKSVRTNRFAERFPERSFNFGIAEQNMMAAAAGMATTGLIPFATTYAVFIIAELAAMCAIRAVTKEFSAEMLLAFSHDSAIPALFTLLLPAMVFAAALFASTMTSQPLMAAPGTVVAMAVYVAPWFVWLWLWSMVGENTFHKAVLRERSRDLEGADLWVWAALAGICFFLLLSAVVFVKGKLNTGLRGPRWRFAVVFFVGEVGSKPFGDGGLVVPASSVKDALLIDVDAVRAAMGVPVLTLQSTSTIG